MQVVAQLEPLHGLDRAPLRLGGQHQAGEHRPPVEQHRAGAALAELAAMLGARKLHVLTQHLEQRLVHGQQELDAFAVDV